MNISISNGVQLLYLLSKAFWYHLHTAYLFSCSDLEAAILTPLVFGLLNSQASHLLSIEEPIPISQVLLRVPRMLIWLWSALLLFNLHNQRHEDSVKEDTINKPWRPLPAGRLTADQATVALFCLYPLNIILSVTIGGIVPFAVIATIAVWNNEFRDPSGGALKNIHNGIGITSFLAGALEIATESSIYGGEGTAAIWMSVIALVITCTIHVQDLRDVDGDMTAGKRTIPIVVGENNARWAIASGVSFWTALAWWFWDARAEGLLVAGLGLGVVWNTLNVRTKDGDRMSYRLWAPWLLSLASFPFLKSLYLRSLP